MANETLTIAQNDARLTVIGKSWADVTTDSGNGITIDQLVIGEIEDITGLDLPDIGDNTHIIVGDDESGDPQLYIEGLDEPYDLGDLDLDLLDLDFELGSSLVIGDLDVSVDDDLKIKEEELPTSIVIVTKPKKLRYVEGSRIDLSGMVVTAKKEDGSTWTSAKYPNGHIPLGELIVEPYAAVSNGAVPHYTGLNYVTLRGWNQNAVLFQSSCYFNTGFVIGYGWGEKPCYIGSNHDYDSAIQVTRYNGAVYVCAYPNAVGTVRACCPSGGIYGNHGTARTYWASILGGSTFAYVPESDIDPAQAQINGTDNEVTITWLRPGDSLPLSASFDINVIPRGHGGGR